MEPDTPASAAVTDEEPLDWDDDAQIDRAIKLAVADALRMHKENGWFIVVAGPDGKPVEIPAEKIVVPVVE